MVLVVFYSALQVKKVSMSSAHTLFLTHKGEVYACGASANFETGKESAKLVVSPIKIVFSGEVCIWEITKRKRYVGQQR